MSSITFDLIIESLEKFKGRKYYLEMAIPEIILKGAEQKLIKFHDMKIPVSIRDQVKLIWEVDENSIILFETRPHFQDPDHWTKLEVAKLEYNMSDKNWLLYCYRTPGHLPEGFWQEYDPCKPSKDIADLLNSILEDENYIFWG